MSEKNEETVKEENVNVEKDKEIKGRDYETFEDFLKNGIGGIWQWYYTYYWLNKNMFEGKLGKVYIDLLYDGDYIFDIKDYFGHCEKMYSLSFNMILMNQICFEDVYLHIIYAMCVINAGGFQAGQEKIHKELERVGLYTVDMEINGLRTRETFMKKREGRKKKEYESVAEKCFEELFGENGIMGTNFLFPLKNNGGKEERLGNFYKLYVDRIHYNVKNSLVRKENGTVCNMGDLEEGYDHDVNVYESDGVKCAFIKLYPLEDYLEANLEYIAIMILGEKEKEYYWNKMERLKGEYEFIYGNEGEKRHKIKLIKDICKACQENEDYYNDVERNEKKVEKVLEDLL